MIDNVVLFIKAVNRPGTDTVVSIYSQDLVQKHFLHFSDKIYNDRGCSYETDDGCIVKVGFGGTKQPWCFCNTNLCNNLTMEQYKMTNDMIQPGSDAGTVCY